MARKRDTPGRTVNGIAYMAGSEITIPAAVQSVHGSEDGRGIVAEWFCGHCEYKKNDRIRTRSTLVSKQCDWCLANNTFDFRQPLERAGHGQDG